MRGILLIVYIITYTMTSSIIHANDQVVLESTVKQDEVDTAMTSYLERLVLRFNLEQSDVNVSLESQRLDEIKPLQKDEYSGLIDFATYYDLFNSGFEYFIGSKVYRVEKKSGEFLANVFYIEIFKDGNLVALSLCEVSERVDGVLYVSKINNLTL